MTCFSFRRLTVKGLFLAFALCSLSNCAAERRNADAVLQAREMEWASMRESSYKAVDLMIEQMGPGLKPGMTIRVEPLTDSRKIAQTSAIGQNAPDARPLGRVLAEQIAARFTQKGFPVSDMAFTKPPYLLVRGYYTVGEDSVFVNLKVISPAIGKVVTGHDYALIKDHDVAALVDPNPEGTRFFTDGWPE